MNRGWRGVLTPGSELYGKAFKSWVFHELSAFIACREVADELSYWRLAGGTEVDCVVGDGLVAVEAKAGARIANRHLKGLRSFAQDHPEVARRVLVCLEPRPRRTEDGIDVLPAGDFTAQLWRGDLGFGRVREPASRKRMVGKGSDLVGAPETRISGWKRGRVPIYHCEPPFAEPHRHPLPGHPLRSPPPPCNRSIPWSKPAG